MPEPDDAIAALEAQLEVGNGSEPLLRLQLGMLLLQAGKLERAESELAVAAELFDPRTAPREHATAVNVLGAVCRDSGRPTLAAELFVRAAEAYASAGADLERGAALHNLGLSRLDLDDPEAAADAFRQAGELLDPQRVPAQAAANLRELGSALLVNGELEAATELLEEAAELAGRAGDLSGEGSAANALGLAHLAREEPDLAVAAFERAVAAHPRSLRPDGYAMARANLALAYEAEGDEVRARLAAGQALAVPEAPEPVVAQARGVSGRCGASDDDLNRVLDAVDDRDWEPIVRAEVDRWSLLDASALAASLGEWVEGILGRDGQQVERVAVVMGRLLELPPEPMRRIVEQMVGLADRLDGDRRGRLQTAVSRSLARFPIPQWMRLKDVFVQVSGDEAWG